MLHPKYLKLHMVVRGYQNEHLITILSTKTYQLCLGLVDQDNPP